MEWILQEYGLRFGEPKHSRMETEASDFLHSICLGQEKRGPKEKA